MDNADFEGFEGMRFLSITSSNDIMLVIVIFLLLVFALIFRLNKPLFDKMISNINAGEQRQSIFVTTEKDSFLFNAFMTFQTLLLCSILLFSFAAKYKDLLPADRAMLLISLCAFFIIFFIYYLFKRILYAFFGTIFVEKATNKMMFTNYQALFCSWGVTLYLPVLWVLLFNTQVVFSIILLIVSFLAYKAILAFRFFNIFINKNTGFLFLSLYLCALEVVPLVFLYEGMIYFIETKNTWT